ncbi:MAG: hypothetical protein NTZ78_08535 [Candidatus Aureabacteria bacterium]|nr:hypothetical protein [Candidatus Auribacterota bacterium]
MPDFRRDDGAHGNISYLVTAQEPEFRSQKPEVGIRTPAATFEDSGYGDVSELMQLLEEVSKLLEAYSLYILASDYLRSYHTSDYV